MLSATNGDRSTRLGASPICAKMGNRKRLGAVLENINSLAGGRHVAKRTSTSRPPRARRPVTFRTLLRAAADLMRAALLAGFIAAVLIGIILVGMLQSVKAYRYADVAGAPAQPIAIVFGAGVEPNGQPSAVLADRVETAIDLYRAGKVRKLLMTGDNRFAWYNEPGAMGEYAMQRGVPAEDIVYDYAGRRTYDSCYRARHIFGVERAILVTQDFHLPRAVYTCRRIGIESAGVAADRRPYSAIVRFTVREAPALLVAWIQTNFTHPVPVMGDPIPINYD